MAAFERAGFALVRTKSSHHILKKPGHPHLLTVPVHAGKDVKPGTLRSLIRGAGLDVAQFVRLLNGETLGEASGQGTGAEPS